MKDHIVEEVRQIRDRQAAKFNYDIDAIFADAIRRKTMRVADVPPRPMPVVLAMAYQVPGPDGQDYAAMPPAPLLANAATATGHVMQSRDPDGILRRRKRIKLNLFLLHSC